MHWAILGFGIEQVPSINTSARACALRARPPGAHRPGRSPASVFRTEEVFKALSIPKRKRKSHWSGSLRIGRPRGRIQEVPA